MDLETMMTKVDLHKYNCAKEFLDDVDLICANALEYNPDRYETFYFTYYLYVVICHFKFSVLFCFFTYG